MELIRDDWFGRNGCDGNMNNCRVSGDRAYNMLAGSIFYLAPGVSYDVRLNLSDPDGVGGSSSQQFTLRTKKTPRLPTGGHTYHVQPGSGGGSGSASDPFRGFGAAQSVAQPGDIFLVHRGNYPNFTFTRSGTVDNPIVWKAAGDGDVIFSSSPWVTEACLELAADYLWIDGFKFLPNPNEEWFKFTAIRGAIPTTGNIITHCEFNGVANAIRLQETSATDWVIANNVMIGDAAKRLDPIYNNGDPLHVSDAVVFGGVSTGIEIYHNSMAHYSHGVNVSGAWKAFNVDIHHNEMVDDEHGVKIGGGYANIRVYENRMTNVGVCLAIYDMFSAPVYYLRNQCLISEATPGWVSEAFTLNVADRFVVLNNLFVFWGWAVPSNGNELFRMTSLNNLWISAGPARLDLTWSSWAPACFESEGRFYCDQQQPSGPTWFTVMDYDGFDWGSSTNPLMDYPDVASFSSAYGVEAHARHVLKEQIFSDYHIPWTANSAVSPYNLTLACGGSNAAVDSGTVIANIADSYSGSAPDLGPFECGRPAPLYGPTSDTSEPPPPPTNLRVIATY
jgi:hypothetical protein